METAQPPAGGARNAFLTSQRGAQDDVLPTKLAPPRSRYEVQAGAVLVRRLLKEHPGAQLVITTQTTTGAARVKELFGDQVRHCYLPYDLPFAVTGFLDRAQPKLALVLETELWPTLLRACRRRGIPILIASARISPRSFTRYRRLTSLF